MDADSKAIVAVVRPLDCSLSKVKGKEEATMSTDKKVAILPLALRETEITEADLDTMLRIVRDKKTGVGRYKRTPKRLPVVERVVAK